MTKNTDDDITEDEVLQPPAQQHNKNKAAGARRHKKIGNNLEKITKGSIRRIARRAGALRLSNKTYDQGRKKLRKFIGKIMKNAVQYQKYAGRKTINSKDVVTALENIGIKIYI